MHIYIVKWSNLQIFLYDGLLEKTITLRPTRGRRQYTFPPPTPPNTFFFWKKRNECVEEMWMIIQTFFIFNLSPLLFSPPSLFISVPFLHLIFSFASEIPFDTVFRRKIPDSSCYIFSSLQLYTSFRLFRLFFSYLEKKFPDFHQDPILLF